MNDNMPLQERSSNKTICAREPERLERSGKRSFLGLFAGIVVRVQEIFGLLWLLQSAQYTHFFLAVHYFNFFVPSAQQARQTTVLGRLSLSIFFWREHNEDAKEPV